MDHTVIGYLVYVAMSVLLTVWVARVLAHNGVVFIRDALHGDAEMARVINTLLQVGFYLLNLGFIALWLKVSEPVRNARELVETVAIKIGAVMLVLGVLHAVNVLALSRIRHRGLTDARSLSKLDPPEPKLPFGARGAM